MIRWYDILLAIIVAWGMLNFLFFPYIGFIIVYAIWEAWNKYCYFRLEQERDK
jgi:hypothetical protein